MTKQETLTKAITKAITGGWDIFGERRNLNVNHKGLWDVKVGDYDDYQLCYWNVSKTRLYEMRDCEWKLEELIYNHQFAKALWGNERVVFTQRDFMKGKTLGDNALPKYLYHLQQMVISDDPIKYLGEHLE